MDLRFKNEYTRDLDMIKEMLTWSNFKRPVRIVVIILLAYTSILSLVGFILNPSDFVYLIFFGSVILLVLLFFFSYKKMVKITAARDKEVNGGKEIEITVSLYDDKMELEGSSGGSNELAYSSLKKVYTTKNLIIAFSKTNIMYTLKKDGFTVGTADECIAFLNGKINK
ncbi:MAG: YcxB family protein [Clostridia bacterium]|nr:YcxB family protein [Clostridia bacterium]